MYRIQCWKRKYAAKGIRFGVQGVKQLGDVLKVSMSQNVVIE